MVKNPKAPAGEPFFDKVGGIEYFLGSRSISYFFCCVVC